jgi:hypothetical protein
MNKASTQLSNAKNEEEEGYNSYEEVWDDDLGDGMNASDEEEEQFEEQRE